MSNPETTVLDVHITRGLAERLLTIQHLPGGWSSEHPKLLGRGLDTYISILALPEAFTLVTFWNECRLMSQKVGGIYQFWVRGWLDSVRPPNFESFLQNPDYIVQEMPLDLSHHDPENRKIFLPKAHEHRWSHDPDFRTRIREQVYQLCTHYSRPFTVYPHFDPESQPGMREHPPAETELFRAGPSGTCFIRTNVKWHKGLSG